MELGSALCSFQQTCSQALAISSGMVCVCVCVCGRRWGRCTHEFLHQPRLGCVAVYDFMHKTLHIHTPITDSDSAPHVLGPPNAHYMGGLSYDMCWPGSAVTGSLKKRM